MADLGKDSAEFKFFQRFWAFLKSYSDHDNSDDTWRKIMAEAREIPKEFPELNKGYPFADNIIFTTLRYLEQRGKQNEQNSTI